MTKLLDLDRFNVRRRELVGIIEAIRRELRDPKLNRADRLRLVDSAPVTVVTYTRGSRCSSVVGSEYFGVVTSKKGKEERLWRKRGILLLPLRKDNQKQQWPEGVQKALGYFRHGVETVFSILTTVFNFERPRGRTYAGYVVRVATCILAHMLSFFLA